MKIKLFQRFHYWNYIKNLENVGNGFIPFHLFWFKWCGINPHPTLLIHPLKRVLCSKSIHSWHKEFPWNQIWIFLILIGGALPIVAATPEETFTQANAAFISGKYSEAIKNYEDLLAQGTYSSSLFYNLANAYFREGKTGEAILNYERALWIDPNDADIKANLRFVRQSIGLFEPSIAWWQVVPRFFSLNTWSIFSFLLFILACTVLILRILKPQWSLRAFTFLFAIAWLMAISSTAIRSLDLSQAVVLTSETPLRMAPFDGSPSSFTLNAGSMIDIKKKRESFLFIKTQDGKMGWVSEQQVQKIVQTK